MVDTTLQTEKRVNWRQVGAFVGLTFALTWLLNLFLWTRAGYGAQGSVMLLQLQMLLPAFSALVLGLFVFRDSAISKARGTSRWFVLFFLGYTLVSAIMSFAAASDPQQVQLFSPVNLAVGVLGLLLVVLFRVVRGRGALAGIGVLGARPRDWLLYGLAFVLFYGLQTALNALFGLGRAVDVTPLAQQAQMPPQTLMVVATVQSILVGPLVALLITFGEEYGWRGYLQGELIKMGRARGVFWVGIIWGIWHAPIILMGHNYPGHPILGVFLMVAYCVMLAFLLGYAVLKTGSIWIAAFLHGVNNQAVGYFFGLVNTPSDTAFSFGIGVYGILTMAPLVLLILRDPVWREGERVGASPSA